MSTFRIPGPVCGVDSEPWTIDEGTLALHFSPIPGPICSLTSLPPTGYPPSSPKVDLSFLFLQCSNPTRGLSDADYKSAATTLGVEVAAIKAVAVVESAGNAFDDSGRPRILFERHYFHRLTDGKYDETHHDISNAKSGGYGKFSAQYGKLERAYNLDSDAALRSASWGRFQIMGNNYQAAGFNSVKEFVLAMTKSEAEQLKAFVNFVASNKPMHTDLKNKNWAGFAAKYNGPSYQDNDYDNKLKTEYERIKALENSSQPNLP